MRRASALGAVAYWPGWVLALRRDAPVHRTATLAVLAIASLLISGQAAENPSRVPEIKAAEELAAASTLSEQEQLGIHAKRQDAHSYYAQDPIAVPNSFLVTAPQCGAAVGYQGSRNYEETSACGQDRQRRSFVCPAKIKQSFGFGPTRNPGSREGVLHCVAGAAGVLLPVGFDIVHLAHYEAAPTWQFAVVADAIRNSQLVHPTNGLRRRTRAILSRNFQPTSCDH